MKKTMKTFAAFLFLTFAIESHGTPMVHVIGVRDSHTIVIDKHGVTAEIKLAQVLVAPADEANAVAWLRESIVNSWVMIETDAQGNSWVYRSPDALFVNGELSRRAYDFRGAQMTYLGEVNPGARRAETSSRPATTKGAPTPPPRPPHRHPHRTR